MPDNTNTPKQHTKEKTEISKSDQNTLRHSTLSYKQRDISYNRTMERLHGELNQPKRSFSTFIHLKIVDRVSDILGQTIARPNAILFGSIFAFVLTLFIYSISKTIGYNMSGFETIGSFMIGWIFGNVYDYLKILFQGKKS